MHSRRPQPSRRAVLGVVAVALTEGCRPGRKRRVPARVDPDVALSASVRADEAGLIASYDVVLQAFPELAPTLGPLRDQHEQHLTALATGPDAKSPRPVGPTPATGAAAAVRSLLVTERAAASARMADCLAASPRLAPLLASIGASEAAHASVLAALRPPG